MMAQSEAGGRVCAFWIGVCLIALGIAANAADSSACFYPINARMFRLERNVLGDVNLVRDDEEPRSLLGMDGWQGEVEGRDAMVIKSGEDGTPLEGYALHEGLTQKFIRNGREFRVAAPRVRPRTLDDLWPKELTAGEIRANSIWHADGRFKFGFVNPNYAASFFGSLSILFLVWLCGTRKRIWRVLAATGGVAALTCLVLTASRGGMLAFLLGTGAYVVLRFRHLFTFRRMAVIFVSCVVLLGLALIFHVGDRFTRKMFAVDQGNSERIEIWMAAPRMIYDSPLGWGLGQSGIAYTNWYQPQDRVKMIGGMINSHLTVLVESGWPLRIAYVFLWIWLLTMAFVDAWKGRGAFPLAAGIFLFVAAVFNSVMLSTLTWPVPALAVGCLLCRRVKFGDGRSWPLLSGILALSGLTVGLLTVVGCRAKAPETSVHGKPGVVLVNGDKPVVWFVDDSHVLDAGYLGCVGREVRQRCAKASLPTLAFVRSVERFPADAEKVVVFGRSCLSFIECWKAGGFDRLPKQLIFVSPSFSPDAIPAELRDSGRFQAVYGDLALRAIGYVKMRPSWLKVVPGAMLYIPDWVNL